MSLADKTPWDPSAQHVARVKNKLLAPQQCPYCDCAVRIANHREIYGSTYGPWPWVYVCTGCDAYVGMHPYTNIPLGKLADEALRNARNRSKASFDLLWKPSTKKRTAAYQALAAHLGIDVEQCHFGFFDRATCDKAWRWALEQGATPESARRAGDAAARHGVPLIACPFQSPELGEAWRAGWKGHH